MISHPMPKRPQLVQTPYRIQQDHSGYLQPEGQLIEASRRPSWESKGRSERYPSESTEGKESLVSVVVSEAEAECSASIRKESKRSRGDHNRYSTYTDQCVEGLERQEGGALRIWFDRFSGTPPNTSQESLVAGRSSPKDAPTTPETPSLSLPTSVTSSPASQGPPTPPLERSSRSSTRSPRLRSKTSNPSDSHPSTCGGLNLFFPPSLSNRSSAPNLRPRSEPLDEEAWEQVPASHLVPLNKRGQKYAPPIEEMNLIKRIVWTKPEVRARVGYAGLREPPPIPERYQS
ncbi:hypothetical protein JCM16303_006708 [Sporobolomyces ruberrimus]